MRNANLSVVALVLVFGTAGMAQTPRSATDAFEHIQKLREEGRGLIEKAPREALAKFEAALRYWEQPLVRDLARGDFFLENRYLNFCVDFAEAHARLGEKAAAIEWLERALAVGAFSGFSGFLETFPAFAGLKQEQRFGQLVGAANRVQDYWEPGALKTAFRDPLPEAERLAGLSKFWSEVKYNFAYPERLVEIDWDRLYLEAIPKIQAAGTTADYYRELMRLCAAIGDGHTNVYFPERLKLNSKPPLKTLWIEGHVGIAGVYAEALENAGVRVGMEVVSVDGEDVSAYVKRDVAPFVSAATPQDREMHNYWYAFLRGAEDRPVRLKLRAKGGSVAELTVARTGYAGVKYPERAEFRMLDGDVAYVRADTFGDGKVVEYWKQKFPEIRKAKALVLDLRWNGGGSSDIGFAILADLIDKAAQGAMTRMRRYIPTERAWGQKQVQFVSNQATRIEPGAGPRFTGPVAVLTSGATYSAAEDFLIAFRASGRGVIVGEPSGGSTGQPLMITLPGGGSARICTKQDLMPDGVRWVGVGIQPDVAVKPKWSDFLSDRDTVLEAALERLRR